ncbi:hypothetical protein CH063_11941 [Colletotrichum higginsianum]|uniref:Uncharacterized protein n=2 Tax=Colletotrichum higginsianum TaxID=80884 RepID=H1VNF5_COLHI|nr:hypothetical protein CH63R_03366 [Colletotrichum higginsianum IMI 349063]OBR14640.1 hypothetical protein CH63R_03366 [Colletotrichum higginsianum IMI 349063]TID02493.1 hypothetical protein CH35J_004735 [Colletotrichum higginsianum]GJD05364.1 hypothetical protein ColKHC_14189 [Colletotrichum higginsianum]CCF41759.1 hypothetical protein CH063_11941 [Colletotrichum higginsianum]
MAPTGRFIQDSCKYAEQRGHQVQLYNSLSTNLRAAVTFVFIVLTFLSVVFGCTILVFSTNHHLTISWATFIAFCATTLALLVLFGTLPWWHYARPHLPKMTINCYGCRTNVLGTDPQDLFGIGSSGSSPIDTSARTGLIIAWVSLQIVSVADMIFGHKMPSCLPPFRADDEHRVGSGLNVDPGTIRRIGDEGEAHHEPMRSGVIVTEKPSSLAPRDQEKHRSDARTNAKSFHIKSHSYHGGHVDHIAAPKNVSGIHRKPQKDWDELRRHHDKNRVPLHRQGLEFRLPRPELVQPNKHLQVLRGGVQGSSRRGADLVSPKAPQ